MFVLPRNVFRFIFLLIVGASLSACGGSAAIKNGENISNLSGKAGSQKTYSIKLQEGTVSLLAQTAGHTAISLEILDGDGNSMNSCDPWLCVLTNPPAGNYKLRLTANSDYSNVNLSVSWGGPNDSVVKNGIPLEGLAGSADTVLIKSVYLSDFQPLASIEISDPGASVEWLNSHGDVSYRCAGFSCVANAVAPGLYFVRVRSSSVFEGAALKVAWGESIGQMLSNAETNQYTDVVKGSWIIVPFVVPDDVKKWMIASSNTDIRFYFMDGNAQYLNSGCASITAMRCMPEGRPTGLIYAVAEVTRDSPAFGIALRFAGPSYVSLQSGLGSEPKPAEEKEVHAESFLVETPGSTVALNNTKNAITEVIDEHNNQVCWSPCYISNLPPGNYFTVTELLGFQESSHVNVSLAVSYSGEGTLTLGNKLTSTVKFTGENRSEIFFAETGSAGYLVVVEGVALYTMHDSDGVQLSSCGGGSPCFVPTSVSGPYFINLTLLGNPGDEYSIELLSLE